MTNVYKEHQARTQQVLELTKQLKEMEHKKMELQKHFDTAEEVINKNAEQLMEKAR